jgi:leucyl-tRNA synthetase
MKGVEGVSRFLARVWRLIMEENQGGEWVLSPTVQDVALEKRQLKLMHASIKKVSEDIEALAFNTAISQMMVYVNEFTNAPAKPVAAMRMLLVLLNPFAPHVTSELWEILNHRFPDAAPDITDCAWPLHNPDYLIEDEAQMVIQVNGKVRGKLTVPLGAPAAEVEAAALADAKVQEFIAGNTVRKVVVVPNKLVNIVAN